MDEAPNHDNVNVSGQKLDFDKATERAFVSWFGNLPRTPQLLRFFSQTGQTPFFTAYGENALFIARQFYKTLAVVKYLPANSPDGLPYVNLNRTLYETVLRELLLERAEYNVEVYEGSGSNWRVARRASPGRLGGLEEEVFRTAEMTDSPVVVAVTLQYLEGVRTVGVAFADVTGRRLGACEFAETDDHLCLLEAVCSQVGPKEAVVPKDIETSASALDARRLRDVLSRCGALVTDKPRGTFSAKNLETDLGRLIRGGNVEQHRDVLDRPLASQALAAALAFLELTADADNHGRFSLSLHDLRRYMRLDAEAQRALNVMRSKGDANDSFSLYGLLNRCRTSMGKRLLRTWLKQPLIDTAEINRRLDVVEAFASDPALRDEIRGSFLRGLPDVERLTRKLERRRATLADLCQLYRVSARLPHMAGALRNHEGHTAPVLASWFADRMDEAHDGDHLRRYEELLEAAMDLDKVPEEYLISASYSDDLRELSEDKAAAEEAVQDAALRAAKDLGLQLDKTVKLEWQKINNQRTRCLRITQKEEIQVRKQLQARYVVLETKKDGVKFTNKELRGAAERLQTLSSRYESVQKDLVDQVVGVAATFAEVWEGVGTLVAELDILAAFGDLSASAPTPYVRPKILEGGEGTLVLKGCRHPCVEAQEGVNFIANDCVMERGASWFHIITGPNMGGKSTYIRQVGVSVLMAQVGCFVPCDEAEVAVRDAIFARVGAGDNQLRGVSTFMAEMLETSAILKGATDRSLVIVDELGRGTSTYDGFGLAWAISEHLMEKIGCPTLFATHFHELTELRGSVGVSNRHVESTIDPGTGRLTMLYRVKEGACDQSFGIHVAEYCNFPPVTVALAKRKAEELEASVMKEGAAWGTEFDQAHHREGKRRAVAAPPARDAALEEARAFLGKFAALPMAEMAPGEALAATRSLLLELEAKAEGNACLRELIETGTAL